MGSIQLFFVRLFFCFTIFSCQLSCEWIVYTNFKICFLSRLFAIFYTCLILRIRCPKMNNKYSGASFPSSIVVAFFTKKKTVFFFFDNLLIFLLCAKRRELFGLFLFGVFYLISFKYFWCWLERQSILCFLLCFRSIYSEWGLFYFILFFLINANKIGWQVC